MSDERKLEQPAEETLRRTEEAGAQKRRAYPYAGAAVAVALVGYAWASGLFASSHNVAPLPQGKGADMASFAQARQLRFDAGDALDKHDWKKALDLFDRAKAIDPAGDGVPWIEHGRTLAYEGLSAPESPKP